MGIKRIAVGSAVGIVATLTGCNGGEISSKPDEIRQELGNISWIRFVTQGKSSRHLTIEGKNEPSKEQLLDLGNRLEKWCGRNSDWQFEIRVPGPDPHHSSQQNSLGLTCNQAANTVITDVWDKWYRLGEPKSFVLSQESPAKLKVKASYPSGKLLEAAKAMSAQLPKTGNVSLWIELKEERLELAGSLNAQGNKDGVFSHIDIIDAVHTKLEHLGVMKTESYWNNFFNIRLDRCEAEPLSRANAILAAKNIPNHATCGPVSFYARPRGTDWAKQDVMFRILEQLASDGAQKIWVKDDAVTIEKVPWKTVINDLPLLEKLSQVSITIPGRGSQTLDDVTLNAASGGFLARMVKSLPQEFPFMPAQTSLRWQVPSPDSLDEKGKPSTAVLHISMQVGDRSPERLTAEQRDQFQRLFSRLHKSSVDGDTVIEFSVIELGSEKRRDGSSVPGLRGSCVRWQAEKMGKARSVSYDAQNCKHSEQVRETVPTTQLSRDIVELWDETV